jgi:Cu2+-exporting ATPase
LVKTRGLGQYYSLKDRIIAPAGSGLFQPRDYAWLEEMQRQAEIESAPPAAPMAGAVAAGSRRPPEMVLDLQGISCVGCVWLIERLFEREPGARRIEINAQLGRVRMRWESGEFKAARFARTLQSFNYFLGPPGAETSEPAESRDLAKRIGLCAAFAMNIMLFTLPNYFGMTASFPYARLFGTLAMLFGTLSFFAGGSYFLGRAARAVRERVLHIDLPIALGILGAYAGSVYGWLAADAHFAYFDFVGSFILLMLIGRWAQVAAVERNRRRLLGHSPGLQQVRVYGADRRAIAPDGQDGLPESPEPAGPRLAAVEALQPGQVFGVPVGHLVPVEGRLLGGGGVFTTAWINGESTPRQVRAGQRVSAGAVNVTRGEVRMEALQRWNESLLARLTQSVVRPGARQRLFGRIIQAYLAGIIGLALATGVVGSIATGDAVRAWSAALAVLVVSCPCSLGLALPLADEMAIAVLRRDGVFVRENDLWARLGRVRKIIFDKTGTLTFESPGLVNPGMLNALEPVDRHALFALVRDNPHPVSQCLHEALLMNTGAGPAGGGGGIAHPRTNEGFPATNCPENAPPVSEDVAETIGFGVSLRVGRNFWTLGRPGWRGNSENPETRAIAAGSVEMAGAGAAQEPAADGATESRNGRDDSGAAQTEFCRNGTVIAQFQLSDSVRTDARAEVAALRAGGREVMILSGDHQSKVDAIALELGLPPENGVGEVSPDGKAAWVRRHDDQDTLMLGDGANDSLAFESAYCRGTPVVHRGALESKSDFYYLGQGISGIRRLFAVDAIRARTQRWVIGFAAAYNLSAVGVALTGRMSPLLAAVLMPASALASLAIVALGMRACSRR